MTSGSAPRVVAPVVSMVTDRRRYGASGEEHAIRRVVEDAARAARAGVDLIQIRESGLSDRVLLKLVERVLQEAGSRARVLVNRRTDVALAAAAHGVHLPAAAPGARGIRSIVPGDFLIGRSVHTLEAAVEADRARGCDYLTFGSVYPTASKPVAHEPAGVAALQRVCEAVRLPVLAIGGVEPEGAAAIAAAGAAGVAAIGMFVTVDERGSDADQVIAVKVAQVRAAFDAPLRRV